MPASKLAIYRRKKGLTQEQLAELSGVTARTIQRIETGAVVPHIQTLKMLADCLDIDTEVLMDAPEGNTLPPNNAKALGLLPLLHLLALVGLACLILNLILPLGLWIMKKDEHPEFDRQGKQVLNFHLTYTLVFFPAIILMVVFFPVGFPLMVFTYFFMVVMTVINLYRAIKMLPVKYPFAYPFFKL